MRTCLLRIFIIENKYKYWLSNLYFWIFISDLLSRSNKKINFHQFDQLIIHGLNAQRSYGKYNKKLDLYHKLK